jgi:hypothetical protein
MPILPACRVFREPDGPQDHCLPSRAAFQWRMPALTRPDDRHPQKIIFAEMCASARIVAARAVPVANRDNAKQDPVKLFCNSLSQS